MRFLGIVSMAIASMAMAAASTCSPSPSVWIEIDHGSGDAGILPASADVTAGLGPLSTICGTITDPTNGVDMYEIMVTGTFSAIASDRPGSTLSPALFLFDSTGAALYGSEAGTLSGLSLTPGIYYLALTSDSNDPKHGGNVIFTIGPGLMTPISGHPVVQGWNLGGGSSGEYAIALTNAGYAVATPEPSTIGLLLIGMGGLAGLRARAGRSL